MTPVTENNASLDFDKSESNMHRIGRLSSLSEDLCLILLRFTVLIDDLDTAAGLGEFYTMILDNASNIGTIIVAVQCLVKPHVRPFIVYYTRGYIFLVTVDTILPPSMSPSTTASRLCLSRSCRRREELVYRVQPWFCFTELST